MLKIALMSKTRNYPNPDSDARVLSTALRKLCLPKWIWRAGVIAITALVWLWIGQQILTVGKLIRYDGLQPLGEQVVSFMTRINPYLWMGVVAILTLIVLSLLRAWFKTSVRNGRQSIVSVTVVQNLAKNLSPEGIDVLKWVWQQDDGPVTIGDLLRTRDQIRSGRIRKLAMARSQHRLLEEALASASAEPAQAEENSNADSHPIPTVTARE